MPSHADDLRVAHVLADSVEPTLLGLQHSPELTVDRRDDGELVSSADIRVEELLRAQLARIRSRDGVEGQELPATGRSDRRWVLDPLDGTHSYLRGVPVWATLVALVEDEVPVIGLVAAPALGRRWWATVDGGAYTGRSLAQARPLQVSQTRVLGHASLAYTTRRAWTAAGRADAFDALCDDVWEARGHGHFWGHVLVAEGAVDVAVEPSAPAHRLTALAPIVEAAGGALTSLDGRPGPAGGSVVSSNGALHTEVLQRLAAEPS